MFAAMKRAGLEPSTVSYNALISACEHCGELDRCAPLPPFQCCVSCRRKAPLRVYQSLASPSPALLHVTWAVSLFITPLHPLLSLPAA